MQYLKEQCNLSRQFLCGSLWESFRNTAIAFFVILFLTLAASLLFPEVLERMMAYIQSVLGNSTITDADGNYSALRIALNNLRATIFCILYGLIPFLFLPALPIGLNAAVLGAITAFYLVRGLSMTLLLSGLLPHGIFEIPALLLAFSCGLYLCQTLTDRIRHPDSEHPSLSQCATELVRIYLTLIAPLLIIAAVVEAYITPVCMSFFM